MPKPIVKMSEKRKYPLDAWLVEEDLTVKLTFFYAKIHADSYGFKRPIRIIIAKASEEARQK
jgi:hypothetical protein